MEKNRWLIRPGVSFTSKGGKDDRKNIHLNYAQVPLDIGFSFYKSAIFGLPGGVRAIGSPYVAYLINNNNYNYNKMDYGLRGGVSTYIGETSKLEFLVLSEWGFGNVTHEDLSQKNYSISGSILFTF